MPLPPTSKVERIERITLPFTYGTQLYTPGSDEDLARLIDLVRERDVDALARQGVISLRDDTTTLAGAVLEEQSRGELLALAAERGVDVGAIIGTGADGAVRSADLIDAIVAGLPRVTAAPTAESPQEIQGTPPPEPSRRRGAPAAAESEAAPPA